MTTEMRSRHQIEVATQKYSKGKESEVATPIPGNKKKEVATRGLTADN